MCTVSIAHGVVQQSKESLQDINLKSAVQEEAAILKNPRKGKSFCRVVRLDERLTRKTDDILVGLWMSRTLQSNTLKVKATCESKKVRFERGKSGLEDMECVKPRKARELVAHGSPSVSPTAKMTNAGEATCA